MSEPSVADRPTLRARLGRPASRSVVAFALLAALGCGLYAASLASWAAWWTMRPLTNAEAVEVLDELMPGTDIGAHLDPEPQSVFVMYGEPVTWKSVDALLLGDGGEYGLAGVGGSLGRDVGPAEQKQVLDGVVERLRAGGWTVGYPKVTFLDPCEAGCDPDTAPRETVLHAGRGDQVVSVSGFAAGSRGSNGFGIILTRPTPVAVYPAAAVAGLFGALAGWWLFAWASRRTASRGAGFAKSLFGFAMFLWWAPIVLAAPQMLWHHLGEYHYSWHPLWEWLGLPALSVLFLGGLGFGLLSLAVAALPTRRPVAAAV
ncbi:hypothetical protein [Catellatospora sichuanensis]|uniref:hypothetical protein n=1 Tax=Catellatospora sichuanensis TaxID=1969805 RepID=UPI00118244F5|nr:hypothetical protein [Catellatospora sichuanensis]